jgi:hypothetical protein
MAIALEGANLTWQRVNNALLTQVGVNGAAPVAGRKAQSAPSPLAVRAFRDLKWWLATQFGNPKLQFLPFGISAGTTTGTDEFVLAAFAGTLLGIYGKKQAVDSDVFLQVIDSATDASTLSTEGLAVLPFANKNDECFAIWPYGLPFGVGLVLDSNTTAIGTTDSANADGPIGFAVITGVGLAAN